MLRSLRVKNLALVEEVTVEFQPGLNVITGETGAGKSVLVGALGLLLGDRGDRALVRAGAEQCQVEATFQLADSGPVDQRLDESGLAPCEDGQLIVRRTVAASGTGRNWVNDQPATVQLLKAIGDRLVDMHGPYDHQSLLNAGFQLDLLDSFGHLWEARAAYEKIYEEQRALREQRSALETDDGELARQLDLLCYQIKEIESAVLIEGEDETLAREQTEVANAARILELTDCVNNMLLEDDASAFNGLATAQKALIELALLVPDAAEWRDEARDLAVRMQELTRGVTSFAQRIEADAGRLQWLETRMALYHQLKQKYKPTVAGILEFLDRAKTQAHELETRNERIAELDDRLQKVGARLVKTGATLSKTRREVAARLAGAITKELRDLGFAHGVFAVELEALAEPGAAGLDAIEFGFAPNAGEPMRPLRAIASSGEISRVMLACKSVLADHDSIPILVFDEIDANVGGEMGNAIGAKLAAVGRHHQVLCITHLPTVAACGATHFVVDKSVSAGRTRTQIHPVVGDARIDELARMLGGRDQTSVTLRHAKELLARHPA